MALEQFKNIDLVIEHANANNFIPRQFASEGDIAGRTLTVQITENGIPAEIKDAILRLVWTNKTTGIAGIEDFVNIDATNGIFEVDYPEFNTRGAVEMAIQIYYKGNVTTTRKFEATVQPINGNFKTIIQSQHFYALTTALNEATKANPRGIFDTLAQLQAAYPNGDKGTYLVKDSSTNISQSYIWQDGSWTSAGAYQAVEIENMSVTQSKIVNNSISPEKTTFFELGKNLFDKNSAKKGYFVNQVTGKLETSTTQIASDSINVKPETNYMFLSDNNTRIAYYDSSENFISGALNPTLPIKTPKDAFFVRISFPSTNTNITLNEQMFVEGATMGEYEPYINPNLDPEKFIKNNSITPEKLTVDIPKMKKTKNLFDKNSAQKGYFVNQTSGSIATASTQVISDSINVKPETNYMFLSDNNTRIAYYDSNENFISGALNPVLPVKTPKNCELIKISFPFEYISIDSQMVVEGTILSGYEDFGFTIDGLIINDANNEAKPILNLPKKLYALVGQEFNIFFDNIIDRKDTEFDFDVICGKGQQFQNFFRWVPDVKENRPLTINIYKNNELLASASSIIQVSSTTSESTKNVLILGDSTTANGIAVTKLVQNLEKDTLKVNLIGTLGTGIYKHEGRSGWKAKDYVESASVSNVTNAFWDSNTSSFNFSTYMSRNNLVKPDYVIINLGINDTFNFSDDETLKNEMLLIHQRYKTIIDSIKQYNSTIKIVIAATIPPNYSQDAFGKSYGSGQTRMRYKRNNAIWVQSLLETYQNKESSNIYVVPINVNLDTRYNFGLEATQVNSRNTLTYQSPLFNSSVHPVESGYWQVADSYWYFLKSFEV